MGERPKHRLTHGVLGGRLCCVSQIKPFYKVYATLARICGIIERRTEAISYVQALSSVDSLKSPPKLKLLPGVDPGFFVILWKKSKKGIAFAYGWV